MATEADIDLIRTTYSRMSDTELMRTALQGARGLTAEGIDAIRQEVERRGMDSSSLVRSIIVQNRDFSDDEIEQYCGLVQSLACPICDSSTERLNGSIVLAVSNLIIQLEYRKNCLIACPTCLSREANDALMKTLLLGWWRLPWGPFRTVDAVIETIRSKRAIRQSEPTNALLWFIKENAGELEAYKDNPNKVRRLIKRENNRNLAELFIRL